MIKKFKDWINESINVSASVDQIKKMLEPEFGDMTVVPEFSTFTRTGEPTQTNVLLAAKDGRSFALNFVGGSTLFSVDFWDKDSKAPIATYYVGDSTLKDVAEVVPEVFSSPNIAKKNIEGKKQITEATESVQKAKPKLVLNPKEKTEVVGKGESEEGYVYGDPDIMFKELDKYLNMVLNTDEQPSLVINGMAGIGKTFPVMQRLKKMGLQKGKDYVKITGASTAAGMYISLYKNNGKLIIYDDCDKIFRDDDALNLLKGALDTEEEFREISWNSARPLKSITGESIPESFVFTGKIIFISNLSQKAIGEALKTRSFMIELALNNDDMLEYIGNKVKDPEFMPTVAMSLKKKAMQYIIEASKKNKYVKLNLRTLVKAIKILRVETDESMIKQMIYNQCSYK